MYVIAEEDTAMNTLTPSQSSQEITRSRRIGVLIYPGCDALDVCGPCEAFHWADVWLPRFGKTGEPGYQCHIIAATPGLVRTISGIEVAATHSYCDIGDGLDTLIVAGGVISGEQACKDPALVEWVRSTAPRVRVAWFAPAVHIAPPPPGSRGDVFSPEDTPIQRLILCWTGNSGRDSAIFWPGWGIRGESVSALCGGSHGRGQSQFAPMCKSNLAGQFTS